MNKIISSVLEFLGIKSRPGNTTSNLIMRDLVLVADMSQSQFAIQLAGCFIGIKCPELWRGEKATVFDSPDKSLTRIGTSYGDPNTITFIAGHKGHDWGIASVQVEPETFNFISEAYEAIGLPKFQTLVGTHPINVKPIKTTFSICS